MHDAVHGEVGSTMHDAVHGEVDDDRLKDMIRDVEAKSFLEAHEYGSMSSDVETPLYPGSTNFTRLSVVLRLMNLKKKKKKKKRFHHTKMFKEES